MATSTNNPPLNPIMNDANGRTMPTSNGSSIPDHKRGPSMTIGPTGTTTYSTNGVTSQTAGKWQFGSINNSGNSLSSSPAINNSTPVHQSSGSLGIANLMPRGPSPSGSPSPIPQPAQASGGRPPSQISGPAPIFGQVPADNNGDMNGMNNPARGGSGYGSDHLRRNSSHTGQIDSSAPPQGPGRGGYNNNNNNNGRGGRGGYHGNHNSQGQFSTNSNYNTRSNHRGRGGYYPGSPSQAHRTPHMPNATTGAPPQFPQMMQGGYFSYPVQYGNVPLVSDPSIGYSANQRELYQQQYPNQYNYPPHSPQPSYRNPSQYGGSLQAYGPGPSAMSRQSSTLSAGPDRAGSAMQTPAQTPATPHQGRAPSMSGDYQRPAKRNMAIQIKNPDSGEIVTGNKSTPSVVSTTPAPTTITPPSRTPSTSLQDTSHTRAESQSSAAAAAAAAARDEDKAKQMREAVAARIAEGQRKKDEEIEEARKAKEAEEEKARMDEEARQAAEREAEAKQKAAEEAEANAAKAAAELKQREEEAQAAAEKKASEVPTVPANQAKAADDEVDFEALAAEMEAEEAAREAEELRKEQEYNERKAAQREIARKKEQEEADEYERSMKEMERQAEELELAREKKREQGDDTDVEAKRLFDELRAGGAETPQTEEDEESVKATTPGDSGIATPLTDTSMGPPKTGRRGKLADLSLDTKRPESTEPSATLKALVAAKPIESLSGVTYPENIRAPDASLGPTSGKKSFKYDMAFLLQFADVYKDKPTLDWDQKIKDTFGGDEPRGGQSARTPSGMGNRSVSSRGPSNASFNGPMGSFSGARTLPPGTTSEQRYAASSSSSTARGAANPFAFGNARMGIPMGRSPSNNPMGGIPNPSRVGSVRGGGASRTESKRNKQSAKHEAEANKSMPLTAGMDVGTLQVSQTGWKPRSIGVSATGPSTGVGLDGYMEADVVQRKVKAALNKMTPENFDKISDQVLAIAGQSKQEQDGRTLRQVIQLVFEKATDEAHWASMYAKFCAKMLATMSPDIKDEGIKDKNGNVVTGGSLFRKYLLNRCQEEFERGWKVNLPDKPEGQSGEAEILSDEYYVAATAKRRGLGLVKFIGELFKLSMLTERIMHECVKKLLDYDGIPDEAEVESLCSLLRTVGKQLDNPDSRVASAVNAYFERINQTMNIPELPSRMRFMLLDIIDLRKSGWASKDADKGPKTIQQIHEEAEAAKQAEELQRLAQQAGSRGGRLPAGRGDVRNFSYNQPPPDNSSRVHSDDLRKLAGSRQNKGGAATTSSFGPSNLGQRTNSKRGLGPSLTMRENSNSSRADTPVEKKDESSQNAFSVLSQLDGAEMPTSPPADAAAAATASASAPTVKAAADGERGESSDQAT